MTVVCFLKQRLLTSTEQQQRASHTWVPGSCCTEPTIPHRVLVYLGQGFSAFLVLPPFNTAPRATVRSHYVNVYFLMVRGDPCETVIQSPQGVLTHTQVENHWSSQLIKSSLCAMSFKTVTTWQISWPQQSSCVCYKYAQLFKRLQETAGQELQIHREGQAAWMRTGAGSVFRV